MKLKLPIQLILVALIAGLAIAGWIFVDSCKHRAGMDLKTIHGDPSCLADMKLGMVFDSVAGSDKVTSNMLVGFSDGPEAEKVLIDTTNPDAGRMEVHIHIYRRAGVEKSWVGSSYEKDEWHFPDNTFIISNSAVEEDPDPDDLEQSYGYYIFYPVVIDGYTYFTLPNSFFENMGDDDDYDTRRGVPIEYTVQSGIWAFDEITKETDRRSGIEFYPGLENVLPYSFTGPSGNSAVYGIYATQDERFVVLITVENKTDLYATFYNIKTKTARDPILVYHSDSGQIKPEILEPNSTCPMGSILLEVQNIDENKPGMVLALALRENERTGEIEIVERSVDQFNWTYAYDKEMNKRMISRSEEYAYYGFSDIFFCDDEIWVISYEHRNNDLRYDYSYRGSEYILQNSPPDPLNELYHGQLMQEILIQGCRDNALFYEGVLSVDLAVANPELRIKEFLWDNGDTYRPEWNDVITRVSFLEE
jgi:hypothetical protein